MGHPVGEPLLLLAGRRPSPGRNMDPLGVELKGLQMDLPLRSSVRRVCRTHSVHGPGGLNCSCCVRGRKSDAKRANARETRRVERVAVRFITHNSED